MACDYCLKTKGLDDTWTHCPMCGQRLDLVRFLNLAWDLFEKTVDQLRNAVYDENGNRLEMDSTLKMDTKFEQPAFDTIKFEPGNVDISRELNWLKLQSDAEKILDEE